MGQNHGMAWHQGLDALCHDAHHTTRVSSVREQDPFGDEQACSSLLGGVRGLAGGKMCGLGGVDGGIGLDQNRDT